MTSADFCSIRFDIRSYLRQIRDRPPQVRTIASIPCHRHIYALIFRIGIGLRFVTQTRPNEYALYVVSVRRCGNLSPASFRFALTNDTLAID
jgi:hypothetical protein